MQRLPPRTSINCTKVFLVAYDYFVPMLTWKFLEVFAQTPISRYNFVK